MQATVGICEDDHDLRGALVRALEREGYRTRTAATGHAAMAVHHGLADYVVRIESGRVIAQGPASELLAEPLEPQPQTGGASPAAAVIPIGPVSIPASRIHSSPDSSPLPVSRWLTA